jgi:deoxyribonuclease V
MNGETFLVDKGEIIGAVVTAKQGGKPVYVSIGHMVSLETAVEIVKHCAKSRIPEPLLQAHKLATKERIQLEQESKVNITEN